MTVDPAITRQILHEEVEAMHAVASTFDWSISVDSEALTVTVKMHSSLDAEKYVIEARCDNYRSVPPYFEFIHPDTGERGTPHCYPADGSFFHPTPCICIQWNRKAYNSNGGPHGDWPMANWEAAKPGTTTLGDMFLQIQLRINKSGAYKGRMG